MASPHLVPLFCESYASLPPCAPFLSLGRLCQWGPRTDRVSVLRVRAPRRRTTALARCVQADPSYRQWTNLPIGGCWPWDVHLRSHFPHGGPHNGSGSPHQRVVVPHLCIQSLLSAQRVTLWRKIRFRPPSGQASSLRLVGSARGLRSSTFVGPDCFCCSCRADSWPFHDSSLS